MIQKELRRQHQKGNVIPLKLWTLCSAITQALKLMAADSEVSCSLKKDDPPYEDVPVSKEKEGKYGGGGLHLGLRPNLRMIVQTEIET